MRTLNLGELVTIKGGGTPDKSVSAYWGGPIPWASVKDFKSTEITKTTDAITMEGVKNSATNIIPAGAILVPTRMAVGKAAINTIDLAINQDIKALFPKPNLYTRYLLHVLLANSSKLEGQASGATVKGITIDTLKAIAIPLPPLDEQKRIAAILDQADELRRLRQRAIDRANELEQAIFYEMFGDPAKNQMGWLEAVLGDVVHSVSDGPHVSPEYSDSGIPFLSARHIRPSGVCWEDLKYISFESAEVQWRKCKPERGDILYTKGGTTGIATVVDFDLEIAIWVHIALLKPDRALVDPYWLATMLNGSYCYRQSQTLTHGIANRDLGLKRMVKIKMFLPPIHLQQKFAERLLCLKTTQLSTAAYLAQTEHLFSSLQHRAFCGEL
jgi:type I restriction enzyme S subunit